MDRGFYHPDRGYWQTNDNLPDEVRANYPNGTVEVPLKPGSGYEWDGFAWVQSVAPTEILAKAARLKRNKLLAESDWTQVADAPVNRQAWASYRQALRDIPQQKDFPKAIIWPAAPV